jgi:hypothetical protein
MTHDHEHTDDSDTEFAELRTQAAQLPPLRPSRDLWDGIAARIETPTIALNTRSAPRSAWLAPSRLVAAAALLVAVTAGATWQLATRSTATAASDAVVTATALSVTAEPVPVEGAAVTPVSRVSSAYDQEIAQLRTILEQSTLELDEKTVRVVAENLRVIDDAIAAARQALAADPASALLSQQLAGAYDMKLDLLRRLAALSSTS